MLVHHIFDPLNLSSPKDAQSLPKQIANIVTWKVEFSFVTLNISIIYLVI